MCKLKKAPRMHKCPKTSVHDFTASDVPKLSYSRFSRGTAKAIDRHPAYILEGLESKCFDSE